MDNLQKILESKNIAELYNYIESIQLYSLDQDIRFSRLWNHPLCDKDKVLSFRDRHGNSILHLSEGDCFQIIRDVAENTHFDLNSLNNFGENIAFRTPNRPSIIHIYKELGVDINHKNNLGRNMLFYKEYNSIPVIAEGLKAGVCATVLSNDGFSLADYFSPRLHLRSFKKVCNKGSRLNNIIEESLPEKQKAFYQTLILKEIEKEKKKLLKTIKKSSSKDEKVSVKKRL